MLNDLTFILLLAGVDILCVGLIGTAYYITSAIGFQFAYPIAIILTLRLYDKLKERFIDNARI